MKTDVVRTFTLIVTNEDAVGHDATEEFLESLTSLLTSLNADAKGQLVAASYAVETATLYLSFLNASDAYQLGRVFSDVWRKNWKQFYYLTQED